MFLHHSYYHFFYLAQALRRRGWDAINVSVDAPDSPYAAYYHGEDLNLFSTDKETFEKNLLDFYESAKKRFKLMHFAGDGYMSFFPANIQMPDPPDIIEWRRLGKAIAYTASGCNSATAQSSVSRWSAQTGSVNVCEKCVWQNQPVVCNDVKSLEWGRKVQKYCDLVFAEMLPALDYIADEEKVIREPVTTALNPDVWKLDLRIPDRWRIRREAGELLVYHAVGNFDTRNEGGRNIKGTPAVIAAIERLKAEGLAVRLEFVTNMRNMDVRFIQAQADVIVDQLNYGRYGATAREGMMLGKPVICYINPREVDGHAQLKSLQEAPLVSATEESIYQVLKDLLLDPDRRTALGVAGRRYALKWHAAESCAERYEQIYDSLFAGLRR